MPTRRCSARAPSRAARKRSWRRRPRWYHQGTADRARATRAPSRTTSLLWRTLHSLRLRGGALLQMLGEVAIGCAEELHPGRVTGHVVNLVGHDQLIVIDMMHSQGLDELRGLLRRHIAIVIGLYDQYR